MSKNVETASYKLQVLGADLSTLPKPPDSYAQIFASGSWTNTVVTKHNSKPEWNLSLDLKGIAESGVITIRIKQKKLVRDAVLCEIHVTVEELLRLGRDGKGHLKLPIPSSSSKQSKLNGGTVDLRLLALEEESHTARLQSTQDQLSSLSHNEHRANVAPRPRPVDLFEGTLTVVTQQTEFLGILERFLSKMKVFTDIIDEVSKVHPYLNVAWQLASSIYKVLGNQFERDRKITNLISSMEETFNFVDDVQLLRDKMRRFQDVIIQALDQTRVCLQFIHEYLQPGFGGRIVRDTFSDTSERISAFHVEFRRLKERLESHLLLHVATKVEKLELLTVELFKGSPPQLSSLPGLRKDVRRYVIPPVPARNFTGRLAVLDKMERFFNSTMLSESLNAESEPKQRIFVLYGLGGVGKSQIAYKFLEKHKGRFWKVYLVDASTSDTVKSSLQNIGYENGITDSSTSQSSTDDSSDDFDAAESGPISHPTLRWLHSHAEEWLLLFNNADDPDLNLRAYFPPCNHGNIIITSRNSECRIHATSHDSHDHVSGMEHEDSISLLLSHAASPATDENLELASQLVKELGYLPLAIVQAGSYIATGSSLRKYLQIYQKNRAQLLRMETKQKQDDYRWSVYATWQISFDRLDNRAANFLQFCAFLWYEGISEDLFQNALVGFDRDIRGELADTLKKESDTDGVSLLRFTKSFLDAFRDDSGEWNDFAFAELIRSLMAYSLIQESAESVYNIHPLVHAWARDQLPKDVRDAHAARARQVLFHAIPLERTSEAYASRRRLLPHIDALCEKVKLDSTSEDSLDVSHASRFALVYSEAGKWNKAEKLERYVSETHKSSLGAEHLETLTSLANLATSYWRQGRRAEAEILEKEVLEVKTRVLGEEHISTLASMANLSSTYRYKGEWKEAEALGETAMRLRKKVLGAEHPDTLNSTTALSLIYRSQGRFEEAEKLQTLVVEANKRILGEYHPDTINSLANLGNIMKLRGQLSEAEEMNTKVMKMSEKVFGQEHPTTLMALGSLAATYKLRGKYDDALALENKVLDAWRELFGDRHPGTLAGMAELATTYRYQKNYQEAERLGLQAFEMRRKIMGVDHPATLTSMSGLAMTYRYQGRLEETVNLELQAIELKEKRFGPDHPGTLSSMANLATTYRKLGRWKEAEELELAVYEARKSKLGADHPSTMTSLSTLATSYKTQKRWKEAEQAERQVLEVRRKIYGVDDNRTLGSIYSLAETCVHFEKWEEVAALQLEILESKRRKVGEKHQDTVNLMNRLAATYQKLGEFGKAAELQQKVVDIRKKNLGDQHPLTLEASSSLQSMLSHVHCTSHD